MNGNVEGMGELKSWGIKCLFGKSSFESFLNYLLLLQISQSVQWSSLNQLKHNKILIITILNILNTMCHCMAINNHQGDVDPGGIHRGFKDIRD